MTIQTFQKVERKKQITSSHKFFKSMKREWYENNYTTRKDETEIQSESQLVITTSVLSFRNKKKDVKLVLEPSNKCKLHIARAH